MIGQKKHLNKFPIDLKLSTTFSVIMLSNEPLAWLQEKAWLIYKSCELVSNAAKPWFITYLTTHPSGVAGHLACIFIYYKEHS